MLDLTTRVTTALADRYRIERHLGEGGMVTVYLARDGKHDRKVALQVLRPELAATRCTRAAVPQHGLEEPKAKVER